MCVLLMEACFFAILIMVLSEPTCDQTEFLHPNGTCTTCPLCAPGAQLSEDCGFGFGGAGVCVPCEDGTFSADTGPDPCWTCTQCSLLNRLLLSACSPSTNAICGRCLPGYYELKSMTREVELLCVPCNKYDQLHEECLLFTSQSSKSESQLRLSERNLKEPAQTAVKEENLPLVLTGVSIASLFFLISLLLWVILLTAERFCETAQTLDPKHLQTCSKQELREHLKLEGPSAGQPQYEPVSLHAERASTLPEPPAAEDASAEEAVRAQSSLNYESELHPTSIVINVTTNIKPCRNKTQDAQEGQHNFTTEEMEQKLQKIWEAAQGQSIDTLDYDSIQDMSLLLDTPENIPVLRKLGLSLGVAPQITAHIHSFQELFHYLRTSTYTQLPQLAQAAALLPNFEVVARIHRAVVNQ